MNWYVVYTKPKWEKKVAQQLEQLDIECYCPLIKTMKQWSDRKKLVEVPLFNSYVFVRIEEKDRDLVFNSLGATRFLFWLGKPAIVKEQEIDTIKEWLSHPDEYQVEVDTISKGDFLTIPSGPFSNQKGIVQEVNNNYYSLVLESLGCVLKMKYK
jgi:transcriptional antiterminator RfaH